MKVIAKSSDSTYICEVTHTELEKFFDKYYGKMNSLSAGQEVNLGQGHDFSYRIKDACDAMTKASNAFGRAQSFMTKYALAISKNADKVVCPTTDGAGE